RGGCDRDFRDFLARASALARIAHHSLLLARMLRLEPHNPAARAGLARNLQLSRLLSLGYIERKESHAERSAQKSGPISALVEGERDVGEGARRRRQRRARAVAADAAGGADRRRTLPGHGDGGSAVRPGAGCSVAVAPHGPPR